MSFKTQAADDGKKVFLNSSEFAEEITYTPAGAQAKVIKAVVVREGLAPGDENLNRSLRKQAELYIACDDVEGVLQIDKKDDRVTLADAEGIEREARVTEVVGKEEGMWHLLVGW